MPVTSFIRARLPECGSSIVLMIAPSASVPPVGDGIVRITSVSRGEVVLAPLSIGHMSRESGAGRGGPPGHAGPAAAAFGSVASPPVNTLRVAHQSTMCIIPVIFWPRRAGLRNPPFKNAQTLVPPSKSSSVGNASAHAPDQIRQRKTR